MTTTAAVPPPAPGQAAGTIPAAGAAPEPVDENIWLEDIYGQEQLAWVREQNARTEELLEDAEYTDLEGRILEVLDSTDRIPMVGKHGEWYYNFWKDRENPRGLWRRTSWDSYRAGSPAWDVLLDVDALAAAEGQDWVFHGANFLRPRRGRTAPAGPAGALPRRRGREPLPRVRRRGPRLRGPGRRRLRPPDRQRQCLLAGRGHAAGRHHRRRPA